MVLSSFRVAGSALVWVALSMTGPAVVAQAVPDDVVIKLERTSCFGECPVYSVSIDAKGNVTYEGTKFVRVEGRQTDRIPVSRVAALLETADRIRFFELNDRYRTIRNPDGTETMVTDLPTTIVTIIRAGRSRRVEDYIGAPASLKELEQQIDDAARTTRWIGLDEPTLRQLAKEGWSPSAEERAELLRKALQSDDVGVVRGLIEIGADPNGTYYGTNTTPLMMVRSAAAVRALLEAGAIPFARNENGLTPLGRAVHLAPDVTELLLKAGVQADQPADADGRTALWQAACRGNAGVVKLLLDAGADPSHRAGDVSAVECARRGKEDARSIRSLPIDRMPPFPQDFDRVITLLERALAGRRQP
jgi:hypothetical protein